MRNSLGLIIALLLISSISIAQEEAPKYNFGSAQGDAEIKISPGKEGTVKLFFYNIFGNRITHIRLDVSEAPEDWVISFDPSSHTTAVNLSGVLVNVTENLFVEPSKAVDKIPEDVPESIEYISSSVGYIGAKPVIITIKVPEDEQVGKVENITISGVASWLGQTGNVAIVQSRDFTYQVTVVAEEFTEEIILPEEGVVEREAEQPAGITGLIVANPAVAGIIIILVLIILGLLAILLRKPKKRRR